ncbi:MAG: aminotransferase class V-fold PLP-dependent enzyme [Vicinamibacterales bacterium]|nr:aminotransferase class V-fold PLP-dependent enzyme [Vicinamibacterales bacterium]
MWSRRSFLRMAGALGAAVTARPVDLAAVQAAGASVSGLTPDQVAADEFYWREIQSAFMLDRTLINLNNGNSCPTPTVVHEAYKRYLDSSNQAPVHHRGLIERNIETARRRLAREFGCDPEEMAITRNASEALQIAQNGLDLEPGDEVVTTDQDYGRMLTTWDQRVRRDKITVSFVDFPVPTTEDDLYARIEKAITPRTKVLHFCHITNLTGQLFPVQRLSRMARARGITTIVDGAHAVAHFPFALRDLECDFYGTSLHKWLLAPTGTGFLYVRRERIAGCWPLQAAPRTRTDDIRKFEEIGTSPAATKAAINEALAFHQAIGTERKAARLRYLTLRWANQLKAHPRIRLYTDLDHVYGVANVGIEGMKAPEIYQFLWDRYRIITAAINREDYSGIRVTPNIYTPLEEIDTFVAAMQELVAR